MTLHSRLLILLIPVAPPQMSSLAILQLTSPNDYWHSACTPSSMISLLNNG